MFKMGDVQNALATSLKLKQQIYLDNPFKAKLIKKPDTV